MKEMQNSTTLEQLNILYPGEIQPNITSKDWATMLQLN